MNPNILLRAKRNPDQWTFDPISHKQRNRVERLLAKANQFRRIATRSDKLKATTLVWRTKFTVSSSHVDQGT